MEVLAFASDYQEGAHEAIMNLMVKTNLEKTTGYGSDDYTSRAKDLIKKACGIKEGEVYFLVGGTQVNATVISALLKDYEGVISADTGHIYTHEAGAIEYGGHKILPLKHDVGKISAEAIDKYCKDFYGDGNHEHMVYPGMVYLSQPTEYGTLYSKKELKAIRKVCDRYGMRLYVDGARLAYALACPSNDVSLKDMAELCDIFYIGGTKCGALFGEAIVYKDKNLIPNFVTMIKRRGALLAKGRMLGLQFLGLFTDDLYNEIGKTAIKLADELREGLVYKGYKLAFDAPTNQIFIVMDDDKLEDFSKRVSYSFWEKFDDTHTVIRLVTSWSTTKEDVDKLLAIL